MNRFALVFATLLLALGSVVVVEGVSWQTAFVPRSTSTHQHQPASAVQECLQNVRGGEVHEPATLPDVEGLLIKAGAQGQLVVIDFSATWCGPCKMIAPLFKELSDQFANVVFLKVDVDESPETAAKYSVSAMPTFLFIKGGEVVERMMGANPAQLQSLIEELAG
mmetsp:Transcript_26830/g.39236  ORF Transcript_26830/g.39236 Transcript_26830/m.39236 type:complete len:165 (+) Transcript_26830:101-595(+)